MSQKLPSLRAAGSSLHRSLHRCPRLATELRAQFYQATCNPTITSVRRFAASSGRALRLDARQASIDQGLHCVWVAHAGALLRAGHARQRQTNFSCGPVIMPLHEELCAATHPENSVPSVCSNMGQARSSKRATPDEHIVRTCMYTADVQARPQVT
jgi:hypothetical protein